MALFRISLCHPVPLSRSFGHCPIILSCTSGNVTIPLSCTPGSCTAELCPVPVFHTSGNGIFPLSWNHSCPSVLSLCPTPPGRAPLHPTPEQGCPSPHQAQLVATIQLLPGFPDVTACCRMGPPSPWPCCWPCPCAGPQQLFPAPRNICPSRGGLCPVPRVPLSTGGSRLPEVPSRTHRKS